MDERRSTGSDGARAREQQHSLVTALEGTELTPEKLWTGYFAMGGDAGFLEIDAYVHGIGELPALDRDILAHVVNERLDQLAWSRRARYSRTPRDSEARSAPLAALVELLDGAHLAAPERLPAVAHAAGRALGVEVTMYLVDHHQRRLRPIGGAPGAMRDPGGTTAGNDTTAGHDTTAGYDTAAGYDVDASLPGRAFRAVRTLPSEAGERPRLWVPLLDGSERLGVLDVRVEDPGDLDDPGLRAQCRWLSRLLGHLVSVLGHYGDALDRARRSDPPTPGAELVRSLLPPLTAGVGTFVVTGAIEPGRDRTSDIFDYALSGTTASLLVLTAAGRDQRGGLVAAGAVAAYRAARHAGHGLSGQAGLIDETIAQQFGRSRHAGAVLAELDLTTGRLRYLTAGHPEPLIVRDGAAVRPLTGGRRVPLGAGPGDPVIGEDVLRPGDLLVLHTAGLTGARDAAGEAFGRDRLAGLLRGEAGAGRPAPETARLVLNAVCAHGRGALRDDATLVLARWGAPPA